MIHIQYATICLSSPTHAGARPASPSCSSRRIRYRCVLQTWSRGGLLAVRKSLHCHPALCPPSQTRLMSLGYRYLRGHAVVMMGWLCSFERVCGAVQILQSCFSSLKLRHRLGVMSRAPRQHELRGRCYYGVPRRYRSGLED